MKDDIDLPHLPECLLGLPLETLHEIQSHTYRAIKADRQQRGEPVAWMHKNSLLSLHGDPAKDRVQLQTYLTRAQTSEEQMPLYVAPQPTAPAQKECSKGAERPEQECSDAWQCWEPCGDLGKSEGHANVAPAQEPSEDLMNALRNQRQIDRDGTEVGVSRQALDEAIALLARYGQPVEPEGWKLVPVEPTSKQIVLMACQIKGADADGRYRTVGADWPDHVNAAERAYKCAIEDAPKFGEEQ